MRLKTYLALLIAGTLIAWSGFFLVINLLTPDETLHVVWFYITFGLSLFGTLHLGFFAWDSWRKKFEAPYRIVVSTERQAAVLTLFLLLLLWLQTNGQLRWWLFVLALVVLIVGEYLFLSHDEQVHG
jgi:hypothetical protein